MSGYLQRKKPMKRGKPLRKMSAKKAARIPRYRSMVRASKSEQRERTGGCLVCRRCKSICDDLETHHTHGRSGDNLFIFVMLCAPCHRHIHTHAKQARIDGWIIDSTKRLSS